MFSFARTLFVQPRYAKLLNTDVLKGAYGPAYADSSSIRRCGGACAGVTGEVARAAEHDDATHHLKPGRDNDPRDSPITRKGTLSPPPTSTQATIPFAFAPPPHQQPTKGWKTLERERLNAGSPTRTSSHSASRPKTLIPLNDSDSEEDRRSRTGNQAMDVDDGAHSATPPHDDAHPAQRRAVVPRTRLTLATPNPHLNATPTSTGAQTLAPMPTAPHQRLPLAPPPRCPMTETLYIALPPKDQSTNPHRKLRDYDPISTGPEGLEARISFQMNLSPFDAVVLDVEHELRNVDPKFLTQMDRNPDQWTLISFFLGGSLFFELWKPDLLIEEVTKVLVDAQLAEADDIEILPLPLLNEEKDPYGTSVMAMRVTDREVRTSLVDINLFACDLDLTFAIVKYDKTAKTWTLAIMNNGMVAKMVERATSGRDNRPLTERLEDFARTVTVRFFPASKHWAAYAKPLTTNSSRWEDVRAAIRGLTLDHVEGFIRFEPVTAASSKLPTHPRCPGCKNDNHVRFGCDFVHGGHGEAWWGTKFTLINEIPKSTGGVLTKSRKDARSEARGTSASRNGGPPSGGKGRGRQTSRGGRGSSQRR
ncbi:hypothetical protein MSAN_01237900 [Mycena sanguinolenta]|uniref:Uncharacterized protein n=1 Tax=Mycena sanguinolenta TaxID=230812 RepID=A0A8H7D2E3_9AGAR|nr:hypothetical protein MSAN_01237900 [Mycena sanguinolenta]